MVPSCTLNRLCGSDRFLICSRVNISAAVLSVCEHFIHSAAVLEHLST